MTRPNATRILIEVTAGLFPGRPDSEWTRRYVVTDGEVADAKEFGEDAVSQLIAERVGKAQGYATLLMLQPERINWVKTEQLVF